MKRKCIANCGYSLKHYTYIYTHEIYTSRQIEYFAKFPQQFFVTRGKVPYVNNAFDNILSIKNCDVTSDVTSPACYVQLESILFVHNNDNLHMALTKQHKHLIL